MMGPPSVRAELVLLQHLLGKRSDTEVVTGIQ